MIFEMSKTLEQRTEKIISIDLPIGGFSALSHLKNIVYCIQEIKDNSKRMCDPVVGYYRESSTMGTRHILHRVLPKESAEELKRTHEGFDYVALYQLLSRKTEIESGKYKIRSGLIIGLNPSYSGK